MLHKNTTIHHLLSSFILSLVSSFLSNFMISLFIFCVSHVMLLDTWIHSCDDHMYKIYARLFLVDLVIYDQFLDFNAGCPFLFIFQSSLSLPVSSGLFLSSFCLICFIVFLIMFVLFVGFASCVASVWIRSMYVFYGIGDFPRLYYFIFSFCFCFYSIFKKIKP